jgi:hypothetical protein
MEKKLNLNKEVITQLTDDSMNSVEGGGNITHTCGNIGTCADGGYELHILTAPLDLEGLCNCMWK